jgi:hypothetical protein
MNLILINSIFIISNLNFIILKQKYLANKYSML